jgi:ATP-dependent Lhr-like helicase
MDAAWSAEQILHRFLATHALVSLADILERYPFEPRWARQKLEEWAERGRAVAVHPQSPSRNPQSAIDGWAIPANFDQVRRATLGVLRREVLTCPPAQFADFLLRWHHLHPEARSGSSEGLGEVLCRLEGFSLPANLWERVVLPPRVPGYQPRWLDERTASGEWTWVGEQVDRRMRDAAMGRRGSGRADAVGDGGGRQEPRPTGTGFHGPGPALQLAFWRRQHLPQLPPPAWSERLAAGTQKVLDRLQQRGASFIVDLAQETNLPPSAVRSGMWELVQRRLVTNDSFQVVRRHLSERARGRESDRDRQEYQPRLRSPSRTLAHSRSHTLSRSHSEGRWSLIGWGHPGVESHAVLLASVLLGRYGVAARELALLDPAMLPWRVLYEVLSRMELAGTVRRGYFVEGLSGAQFALPEAVSLLQDSGRPSTATAPVFLVNSMDPANLYGAGAPFDVALLEGGSEHFLRRSGNWLAVKAGRPVMIVEQHGKRLTALPSGSRDDMAAAVARLPEILAGDRSLAGRRRLSVAEWNGRPVTSSEGRELLEAAGFVRDYQEMTLYAAWR